MNRLKELRKEKVFSQIKMQLLTGIDQSDYSKIERGKRYYRKLKLPGVMSLRSITALFHRANIIPRLTPR